MKTPHSIDLYIAHYPEATQELLRQMRSIIQAAAPRAAETISYAMPAFRQNGILVWFAAHSKHIGFYPRASGIAAFKKELAKYKTSKGSVQFPLNEALPLRLIARMVKFRVQEDLGDV